MHEKKKSKFQCLPSSCASMTAIAPFNENSSRLPHLRETIPHFTPFKFWTRPIAQAQMFSSCGVLHWTDPGCPIVRWCCRRVLESKQGALVSRPSHTFSAARYTSRCPCQRCLLHHSCTSELTTLPVGGTMDLTCYFLVNICVSMRSLMSLRTGIRMREARLDKLSACRSTLCGHNYIGEGAWLLRRYASPFHVNYVRVQLNSPGGTPRLPDMWVWAVKTDPEFQQGKMWKFSC